MKNLFTISFVTIALILTLSSSALADSQDVKIFPITSGTLNTIQFAQAFQSGKLVIDYNAKTVSLTLNKDIAMTLPIVETHLGACGITIVTARLQDSTTGEIDELTVKDNTTIRCRILLPAKGSAVLKTFTSKETFVSEFILDGRKL